MAEELKPITFIHGDETAELVAKMVREWIFGKYPMHDIDAGAKNRLATKDACIDEAVKVLEEDGAGVKISTASNNPDIKAAGMKSFNIVFRPKVNAYATVRKTQAKGNYKNPVCVVRSLKGDFYEEIKGSLELDENGMGSVKQNVDFSNLSDMARLAKRVADENDMSLIFSSKWTIAASEEQLMRGVTKVWEEMGLKEIDQNKPFSDKRKEYKKVLTDLSTADIAVDREGGWLRVFGNAGGDTASDVADAIHGGYTMGSAVYCKKGEKEFVFEELALGTAPALEETDLKGKNFYNPLAIILAFAAMIEQNNPGEKKALDVIRSAAVEYIEKTPKEQRGTQDMVDYVAKAAVLARNGVNTENGKEKTF